MPIFSFEWVDIFLNLYTIDNLHFNYSNFLANESLYHIQYKVNKTWVTDPNYNSNYSEI